MALIGKVQKGQPITADMINNIIDSIRECQIQSVVGGLFRRGIGGTTITSKSKLNQLPITYPYDIYFGGSEASRWFGIRAGTINGIIQSNTAITFSVTSGSESFVNLECTTDGKQVQSASISKDGSPPEPVATTPEVAPSSFKINLYYIDKSLKAHRTIGTSPIMAITHEMIRESKLSVEFGQLPYTSWYSWVFAS